ncbi:hypothetical protein Pint_34207 [Pistacia integerrima]|uniref:Uncharacterized protein n=1 Tax=Pistacia integerrima TaxID=434235 RepID=A0ACC0X4P3_9ROSI|nr:hypothetical protein Pint_34207 [Pistacia integerrima]
MEVITERKATTKEEQEQEQEEEAQADVEIWNYVFGFVKVAVVKCAIELGIADTIENHGGPMTLSELSSALNCAPSPLHRVMRFLVHYQIFKEKPTSHGSIAFEQTPISRRFIKHGQNSMAAFVLLENGPEMVASWINLSAGVQVSGTPAFEAAHGKDIWSYAVGDESFSKLINDAMACGARAVTVPAIIKGCPEVFDGVGSLVDVGGGNGTALGLLVKAFPWIRGINFDLPHVVCDAEQSHGVKNVGGDMFQSIPMADAIFIMQVLHDWGDDECIEILKKCREAIPKDNGKVIIVETIMEEEENLGDELKSLRLKIDMAMMAHTDKGKERTLKEWDYVLGQAGFSRHNAKHIRAVHSVIEAYP